MLHGRDAVSLLNYVMDFPRFFDVDLYMLCVIYPNHTLLFQVTTIALLFSCQSCLLRKLHSVDRERNEMSVWPLRVFRFHKTCGG